MDAGAKHGFQQRERVRGIVAEEPLGKFHGLAGLDGSGEMHDGLELAVGKDALQG